MQWLLINAESNFVIWLQVVVSDSQSSSSIENHSPVSRKNKKRETEMLLRRLSQRITQQKQLILRNLDNQCPKAHIDAQIAVSSINYK